MPKRKSLGPSSHESHPAPNYTHIQSTPRSAIRGAIRSAITATFSERVENHVGMKTHGQIAPAGITLVELRHMKQAIDQEGGTCHIHDLTTLLDGGPAAPEEKHEAPGAYLLVWKGGVDHLLAQQGHTAHHTDVFHELNHLTWDTTFLHTRTNKVLNKHARYNLCMDDEPCAAQMDQGQGTVVAFRDLPLLSILREALPRYLGDKAHQLKCEGNKYYDLDQTGIGLHGDAERKIVCGVRLGDAFPLCYQWFHRNKPVGTRLELLLGEGDIYVMSAKAVGFDWKCSSKLTLRHAAGCPKYTIWKAKRSSKNKRQKSDVDQPNHSAPTTTTTSTNTPTTTNVAESLERSLEPPLVPPSAAPTPGTHPLAPHEL
jgi:hypothetical protein